MLRMLPLNCRRERRDLQRVLRILIQCAILSDINAFRGFCSSIMH
jgi:hypothetical protein